MKNVLIFIIGALFLIACSKESVNEPDNFVGKVESRDLCSISIFAPEQTISDEDFNIFLNSQFYNKQGELVFRLFIQNDCPNKKKAFEFKYEDYMVADQISPGSEDWTISMSEISVNFNEETVLTVVDGVVVAEIISELVDMFGEDSTGRIVAANGCTVGTFDYDDSLNGCLLTDVDISLQAWIRSLKRKRPCAAVDCGSDHF